MLLFFTRDASYLVVFPKWVTALDAEMFVLQKTLLRELKRSKSVGVGKET